MINAGRVGPDVDVLINDNGAFVLLVDGHLFEVDGDQLAALLERARPVATLVAGSKTPISGMSAPVERVLAQRGCTRMTWGAVQ